MGGPRLPGNTALYSTKPGRTGAKDGKRFRGRVLDPFDQER